MDMLVGELGVVIMVKVLEVLQNHINKLGVVVEDCMVHNNLIEILQL